MTADIAKSISFYKRDILVAVIAALATLFGQFITTSASLVEASETVKQEQIKTLFSRISELERTVKDQSDKIIQLSADNLRLEMMQQKKYEAGDVLKKYMDGMEQPAWVKIVANPGEINPDIRMWHVNEAYEREFNVTLERYQGKSDHKIWHESIAIQFRKNDIHVLKIRGSFCQEETVPDSVFQESPDLTKQRIVCKWAFKLEDSVGIAGIIFDK